MGWDELDQDADTEEIVPRSEWVSPRSINRRLFWKYAAERCSPQELNVLVQRAAGEHWAVIAEAYGVTERHIHRVAQSATSRALGGRPPHDALTEVGWTVYAIQASTGGHIKIGKARYGKLDDRIRDLNIGHPEKLELLAVLTCLESKAHTELKAYRYRGEWFRDCDEVRAFINANREEQG